MYAGTLSAPFPVIAIGKRHLVRDLEAIFASLSNDVESAALNVE